MADTIEKVYCTGDGGNDNLAAALLARGRDNDPATMLAAMNGGMGGGWNNPFAYMMMLGMFRFMYGDGWNGQNGNVQRSEIQSQIDSLRTQMSDNHNSDLLMGAIQGNNQDLKTLAANLNCDFNALQSSVCGIQAGIQQISGQVGYSAERVINAISQGNLQMAMALKDCCCQTQQNIINTGIATISSSGQPMRDVTIEVEGKQTIYTIPEHLGVTFAGETVLATDKADLLPEVGKLVNEADEIIKAYEPSKERKAKGEELLAALNPAIKEKQETEKRFKALEGDISGIRGMVKQLLDKLG